MEITPELRKKFATKVDVEKRIREYELYGGKYQFKYQHKWATTPKKKRRYQRYEPYMFNQYQNHLYNRALYGLKVFDHTELKQMHKDKKARIQTTHHRAQALLRKLKQDRIIKASNALLEFSLSLVPKGSGVADLLKQCRAMDTKDLKVRDKFTLKELGITKQQIVDKMIKARILPKNFYQLTKPEPLKLTHHGSRNNS